MEAVAITGLLVLALFFFSFIFLRGKKHKAPPTAPGAWPIIGHLPLLAGTKPPHVLLGELADKCGPIFTIRVGAHRAVVVSSAEAMREFYTTHDVAFSSRPKLAVAKYLCYDYAVFGLSPYGPYWRELRKIATLELLSNRRIELLKHVRVSEVETLIKDLYKIWDEKKEASPGGYVLVELKEWFHHMSLNIILRMVAGKRFDAITSGGREEEEKHEWQNTMREMNELLAQSVVSDAFPLLESLDIGGQIKNMKKGAQKMDSILGRWVEEHRRNKVSRADDEQDFIDVMISATEGTELAGYDADTVIKATCLTIFVGATDTTTITLERAVSALLNNPKVLETAQEEVRSVIDSGRFATESDVNSLVYLQAVVKETLRLYTPAPLSIPRECTKDCIVNGYLISKGTRFIPNVWKLHNDPQVWPDPSAFKPDRFLTTHKDIDVKGQHFELLPFGSGRRGCPGTAFGLRVVHLALANFLHTFDISTLENGKIDMTEKWSANGPSQAKPLEVLIKPRMNIPS